MSEPANLGACNAVTALLDGEVSALELTLSRLERTESERALHRF